MAERLGGEAFASGSRYTAGLLDFLSDALVVRLIDDDRNRRMVLCGSADHRRAADINILDRFVTGTAVSGNRRRKGIKVDDQKIDRLDIMFGHLMIVCPAPSQQATMNFWV